MHRKAEMQTTVGRKCVASSAAGRSRNVTVFRRCSRGGPVKVRDRLSGRLAIAHSCSSRQPANPAVILI